MGGNFSKVIPLILLLGIVALLGGVLAITLAEFGETMDICINESGFDLNTAGTACINNSLVVVEAGCCGENGQNVTDQYYTKVLGIGGIKNVTEQQSTIAIIVVMTIIILALSGLLVYVGYRRLE